MAKVKPAELKRTLGLFEATIYGVGIILGAGIYVLIGKGAGLAGNGLWMAFGFGALISAFTGLSYAELSSMMPKEAAEYVYSMKAFNKKWLSFTIGWLILVAALFAAAAVSLGFGEYFHAITGVETVFAAAGLIIALSALNFWGISESSKANILFTFIEVSGLLLIIAFGFALGHVGSVDYFELPAAGMAGVFAAAALVFFAYIGFEDVVNIAEETKSPRKNVPLALLLAIAITATIYVLVSISAVSIVDWETLGQSAAPLAVVANTAIPGSGGLFSIIALFATANTVLVILIVESRMMYGMGREGSLPKVLGEVHSWRRTPWKAIMLTGMLSLAALLYGGIRDVAEVADAGVFVVFITTNLSLIGMRYKYRGIKRPFKAPLNIGWFPVLPFLGLLSCAFMITHFRLHILEMGAAVILSGLLAYKILDVIGVSKIAAQKSA
ncbi:MAG: APC family permease [Candidatus Aenigmatarchaeota archaeon]